jgi:arsenate reductase (thioredoxin)
MSSGVYNVLFLCKSNSARSIMAEAVIKRVGGGHFRGFSAGSQPLGKINPLVLELLERHQFAIQGLRSKSWEEFAGTDAPHMDFVITLCDQTKGEACPEWPSNPITAHWGIPDPSAVKGTLEERIAAFRAALNTLERRIRIFVSLRFDLLDRMKIKRRIDEIAAIDLSDKSKKQ